jgi:hypothetical protein
MEIIMTNTAPNFYQLSQTPDGPVLVTYKTFGLGGPRFTYQDGRTPPRVFTGKEIRVQATEIATLVTVTLHPGVDGGQVTFTLLVPDVTLDTSRHAPVVTDGITTQYSLVTAPIPRQREHYTVIPLMGTASFVIDNEFGDSGVKGTGSAG